MILTDNSLQHFKFINSHIRAAQASNNLEVPFYYRDEMFFTAYNALSRHWLKHAPQKTLIEEMGISKNTLKAWEEKFVHYGALGLLNKLNTIDVDQRLENLVVLIKRARSHESSSLALRLAEALEIPGASLDMIRQIQRCHGYGQGMNEKDVQFYQELQHIFKSIETQKKKLNDVHDRTDKAKTFLNYKDDHLQHRLELFRKLSESTKRRQTRSVLLEFGVSKTRFYVLLARYVLYGVWGLCDLIQTKKLGEKISPCLELKIIEERLMNPSLSTTKMIKHLALKCSKSNVQKIYARWGLSHFKKSIPIRGVVSLPEEEAVEEGVIKLRQSAKSRFPNLIKEKNLKVNKDFLEFSNRLKARDVIISNPGAIIIAQFLDQLGVIESLYTYGPTMERAIEMTNNIVVNVLRIISGFPTVNDYTLNSDKSVAIGSGLTMNPKKTNLYESFDTLRFYHLQNLRNDTACRARELGIIEGKEIALDYHCDPTDSRYPGDKSFSKSPDKNGDVVYAHRPQIIWDSFKNSIINIAYCEGKSRAPSALYKFCEENLYKIISPDAVNEIYADSEYTGEKQLVYLTEQTNTNVTMCLKQNPRIIKWREETIKTKKWVPYEGKYEIASKDFKLHATGKTVRFVVKRNIESGETRCFGSTHTDYFPQKILASYRVRWPVETGIRDLIENYYLNKPTGTSPEKVETHYYCIMLARLTVDCFISQFNEPQWKKTEDWSCVLSTIRTGLFSNQNCKIGIDEDGDLLITYLDGDPLGIRGRMTKFLDKRKELDLNKVSWWGGIGVKVKVEDQYADLQVRVSKVAK